MKGLAMSETKFTKGPWKFGAEEGVIISIEGKYKKNSKKICGVGYSGCAKDKEDIANAQLIAAATDLYEALEAVKNGLHNNNLPIPSFIEQALSRARGE